MKKIAIAMAHGHTPKWLQVVLTSLKRYKNEVEFDVYVACTWPGHPSVKAAIYTSLGDGVTFIDCKVRKHSHATALEEILEHIWKNEDYDFMFACETDCAAQRAGWLDWFHAFLKDDPKAGIAGFFWHEGKNHHNINPSATLYRLNMLRQYHTEARNNKSPIFWHPNGNKHDSDGGMDPTIKDVVGCFAETRGIENPNEEQRHCIEWGVPQASWWEPGQWLYVRSRADGWGEARVPVDHIYANVSFGTAPEGTYYGGKAEPQFIHYWGGTRAYDFLKHPVTCGFVKGGARWWIEREDRIWRETVPESYRGIVHEITKEANTEELMRQNLGFFVPEAM